jgi:phosphoserine phosphatase RsbU/P
VIEEFQSTHPERAIKAEFDLPNAITVDASRIGQLFSNLLGNTLLYGVENEPVCGRYLIALIVNCQLKVSVAPRGHATIERLFRPFFRGDVRPSQQGSGLGLYIASEIARAHGGKLVFLRPPKRPVSFSQCQSEADLKRGILQISRKEPGLSSTKRAIAM